MDIFKGLLFLEDSTSNPVPLSDEFGPHYGNSIATRQWLGSPSDDECARTSVEGAEDFSQGC